MASSLYRQLPAVDRLLSDPRLATQDHDLAAGAARHVIGRIREGIREGSVTQLPDVVGLVLQRIDFLTRGRLRAVHNATGVVVHTNLGRAPWAPEVVAALPALAGYCNVEMDLDSGKRGGRMDAVSALAQHLTGAEAALVVNNCAAAVMLALTALAGGREVVCSRGELVEIGGSFRVPDVIASGGAVLREVGTTNRTRAADYAAAVNHRTAVLLRVHPSNFRIDGFTESPSRTELVELAAGHGLAMVEDIGSGSLDGLHDEPSVRQAVEDGVDVALFSGDKLLGGPQAGIAFGKRDAIERMRRHPLYRALRVDKLILGAVERTLGLHAAGVAPPVQRMLHVASETLEARAGALCRALAQAGIEAEVAKDDGRVGGGSLPEVALPTWVVRLAPPDLDGVARALRVGDPAVVARVSDDRLLLDVRTLRDDELAPVAAAVAHAVQGDR